MIINLCTYIIEYGTNMENYIHVLAASWDIDAGSASILFFIL